MGQEVRLCRLQIFVFMFLVFVFVFVVWFGKWCSSASQLWPFFVCLFVCVISSESGLYQYVPKYKHRFIQYYYTNRYIYILRVDWYQVFDKMMGSTLLCTIKKIELTLTLTVTQTFTLIPTRRRMMVLARFVSYTAVCVNHFLGTRGKRSYYSTFGKQ